MTSLFSRRTPALDKSLAAVALSLAGRAGSRLAPKLGMRCCRDVLIRLIRATGDRRVRRAGCGGVHAQTPGRSMRRALVIPRRDHQSLRSGAASSLRAGQLSHWVAASERSR